MANPSSDYGAGLASSAQQQGQDSINSFNPTSVANSQKQGFTDLFNTQSGQSNDYVKQYAQTVASNPSVTSLYNTANQQYNVPGLAKTANYYQNQQTNAIPDAYQAARGTDISNTQVQNGVANKLAYVTPQANAATNNLNTAEGLASQYVQAGQAQNTQNLLPVQAQGTLLAQNQAAQATGFTQAMQSEFQGLIDKMNAGVTLSTNEMSRANALAAAEAQYQSALTSATASQNVAKINNQNQILPSGSTYYNPASGQAYNPFVNLAQTMR